MVFTFTYNYLASCLRAVGDTRAALLFLLLSLGYNLLAAWLLVAVFRFGITGTALATASAQLLSSLLCLLYIRKKRPFLTVQREDMVLDRELIRLTSSYAAIAAPQQSSLYLGKLLIQGAVNGIGTAAIAAFSATNRVENFVQAFGISSSEALAIFVAQNCGADQPKRATTGFLQGLSFTVAIGVFFSAGMGIFARPLSDLFLSGDPQAAALCISFLQLISWFYLLSFFGNSFTGWFRGRGQMKITFWGTTVQISIRTAGTYLLVSAMGLNSVALSTGLGWIFIVIFQTTLFLRDRRRICATPD